MSSYTIARQPIEMQDSQYSIASFNLGYSPGLAGAYSITWLSKSIARAEKYLMDYNLAYPPVLAGSIFGHLTRLGQSRVEKYLDGF